jgi:hypothetical protein
MEEKTSIILDENINIKALRLILENITQFKDTIGKAYSGNLLCKFIEGDAFITILNKYYNSFQGKNT